MFTKTDCEKKAIAGDGSFAIAYAILELARVIEDHRTDHPLMGETFDDISSALGDLAEATQNIAGMIDLHNCGKK